MSIEPSIMDRDEEIAPILERCSKSIRSNDPDALHEEMFHLVNHYAGTDKKPPAEVLQWFNMYTMLAA